MAKFSLKKTFERACDAITEFFSIERRDMPTMSDDFAKAAFAKQGFAVQGRESFVEADSTAYLVAPAEATYLLKKANDDGQSYVGTVYSGYVSIPCEMTSFGRFHNITSIKPKI